MTYQGKKGELQKKAGTDSEASKIFDSPHNIKTKVIIVVLIIITGAIGGWLLIGEINEGPGNTQFIDRTVRFPDDEGKHNESTESWTVYLHLETESGDELGIYVNYVFNSQGGTRTTRITDENSVTGQTYYYDEFTDENATSAFKMLDLNWRSGSETDRLLRTGDNTSFVYDYHHEFNAGDDRLIWFDGSLSAEKDPILFGSDGKLFLFEYGTLFGYFQSRLDVQGSIRLGYGDIQNVTGQGWIEHTWGALSISDFEIWNAQLDDSVDLYIARLFLPGTNTIGLEYIYYVYPDGRYEVNKLGVDGNYTTILVNGDNTNQMIDPVDYSLDILRYSIDPRDAMQRRCYGSEWQLTSNKRNLNITMVSTVPSQIGGVSWTGTFKIFDQASTIAEGRGYASMIHDYRSNPYLSNVGDNRAVLDTPHDPTTIRANATDSIPFNVTLIYKIDGGENQTVVMTPSSWQLNLWEGTIPGQPRVGTVVEYKVVVRNLADAVRESKWDSYTVEIGR